MAWRFPPRIKNTAAFGQIIQDGKPLDTSVATVFRAPKSYTGEDVVELSCHGGVMITREVLRVVLEQGAALADPPAASGVAIAAMVILFLISIVNALEKKHWLLFNTAAYHAAVGREAAMR